MIQNSLQSLAIVTPICPSTTDYMALNNNSHATYFKNLINFCIPDRY